MSDAFESEVGAMLGTESAFGSATQEELELPPDNPNLVQEEPVGEPEVPEMPEVSVDPTASEQPEPEVVAEPATEESEAEKPEVAESKEQPTEETPTEEPEPEVTSETVIADLRQQIQELAAEMTKLRTEPAEEQSAQYETQPQQPQKETAPGQAPPQIATADNLADIVSTPEGFNQAAFHIARMTLAMVPQVTGPVVQEQVAAQMAAARFWESNRDLLPHHQILAVESERIQQEHPDWSLEKVYAETGAQARKKLHLDFSVPAPSPDTTSVSATPAAPAPPPPKSAFERAVEEMNDV